MKIILIAALVLTPFVGYAQTATLDPLPLTEEELAPMLDAPPIEESSTAGADESLTSAEPLPAPAVAEETIPGATDDVPALTEPTPLMTEDVPAVEETAAPIVEVTPAPAVEEKVAPVAPAPAATSTVDVDDEDRPFNHRKSNWVSVFGFETVKYTLPLEFTGASDYFKEKERDLYGARLGFGREFYLGWGFLLQGRVDGFYMGTLFEGIKTADPEFSGTDVSNEKDTGSYYGADAVAHLGWMFDYKTKNIFLGDMTYMAMELFVEAGVGKGTSYQRKEYNFDAASVDQYDFIMEDEFTTNSIAAGINVLSTSSGFFLNLKATQVNISLDKRTIREKKLEGGASGSSAGAFVKRTDNDADIDPVTIFAIGGGYKF